MATPALGSFQSLLGGQSQAIAASDGRLITLNASSAVWWEDEQPVTIALPQLPVEGARWSADGQLLVGLGRLGAKEA